jgi:uncharacterized protein YebE (UPF0316 family)
MTLSHSPYFDFLVLPALIFFLRICDMTLDTLRIIFMTKGFRRLAPIIGFFEILIWIIAITRIMRNLDNWLSYVAYAGGFATGNYVGMLVDEKLAIGHELIRVFTRMDAAKLATTLRSDGYGVTTVKASGMQGEVGILYIVANRRNQKHAIQIIQEYDPKAFITVQAIHRVNRLLDKGIFTTAAGPELPDDEGDLLKHKSDS